MPADTPVLAFPPRIVNNQVLELEQGSAEDIAGQVHLLCLTPRGWLTSTEEAREFGLNDQAHLSGGADVDEIERQIATYVPDAATVLEEDSSALDRGLEVLGVRIGRA